MPSDDTEGKLKQVFDKELNTKKMDTHTDKNMALRESTNINKQSQEKNVTHSTATDRSQQPQQAKNFFDRFVEGELLHEHDSLIDHVSQRLSHFYKDLHNRIKTQFKTTSFTAEEMVGDYLVVRIFLKDIGEKNIIISYRGNCYKIEWSRDLQELVNDKEEKDMSTKKDSIESKKQSTKDESKTTHEKREGADEELIPDQKQANPITPSTSTKGEKWSHHAGSSSTTTNFPITNPMLLHDDSCLTVVFEKGEGFGKCSIGELREMGRIKEWDEVYGEQKEGSQHDEKKNN